MQALPHHSGASCHNASKVCIRQSQSAVAPLSLEAGHKGCTLQLEEEGSFPEGEGVTTDLAQEGVQSSTVRHKADPQQDRNNPNIIW